MKEYSELISAVSNFAWPAIVVALLWFSRARLSDLLAVAIGRIEKATDIEFGSLKLKGAVINQSGDVIIDGGENFEIVNASANDVAERHVIYRNQRNLMIVHTIRPSDPAEKIDGLRVFDVSVFLHSHRSFGRLNDVKQVTYFFGDKWGTSKFGSKFIIKSSNYQFALTARMYGSALCVADVEFHDGEIVRMVRYLDVEMAPVYGLALRDAR